MPNRRSPDLKKLVDQSIGHYAKISRAEIEMVMNRVGLQPMAEGLLSRAVSLEVAWQEILDWCEARGRLPELITALIDVFPTQKKALVSLEQHLRRSKNPRTANANAKTGGTGAEVPAVIRSRLDKAISDQPTFFPIGFLQAGLDRSRSIARVNSPLGVGTGFLIAGNLLVTCNHVIPSASAAVASTVWFNYQQTPHGSEAPIVEYKLDPEDLFATSSTEDGDDWTVVKIEGNAVDQWGALEFAEAPTKTGEFVSVIQHPAGMPKQISLYHSVVADADERRVQYLTETFPGSSGSPVFDSQWRVVAIHRVTGDRIKSVTGRQFFRNEGTSSKAFLDGLKAVNPIDPRHRRAPAVVHSSKSSRAESLTETSVDADKGTEIYTLPDYFQDESEAAQRSQVDWLERQLRMRNAFFARFLRTNEECFQAWRGGTDILSPEQLQALRGLWQTMLHLLSFLNFDVQQARSLLDHKVSSDDLNARQSPLVPSWIGSSMRIFLAERGITALSEIDRWVTAFRFGDPYAA